MYRCTFCEVEFTSVAAVAEHVCEDHHQAEDEGR